MGSRASAYVCVCVCAFDSSDFKLWGKDNNCVCLEHDKKESEWMQWLERLILKAELAPASTL